VVGDLLDSYIVGPSWDEMFVSHAEPRAPYLALYQVLQALSSADLDERSVARDRSFRDQGITFSFSGEERPFPLDLMPRIISADEWSSIEAGVIQRVRALEYFLADVYGPGEILSDKIVPRSLVTTSTHFHRAALGINPSGGVRVHVAGVDLVRDRDGTFKAL
jgi:uncharacterized circularly permuted ATP-grasp superfamily protein